MPNYEEKHYDLLTITLHWVMALMIFFLFGLGLYMVELTYYDPWYRSSTALHKSIGLCLFTLLVVRILWRIKCRTYFQDKGLQRLDKTLEEKLANAVHILLYVLILFIFFSGYLIATAGQREVSLFSIFDLPPLPFQIESQEDLAGEWHFYLAWTLIIMVVCHALAALKHHFYDKDNVLKNMLKPSKIKKGDN
ncbi:MAG: cytochrome b561 [Oleiphilaceae bacterium]|jgi:cytochrome b561